MAAHIQTTTPYGSVTADQIADFEKRIGWSLPEDYRAFLLATNGGVPEKRTLKLADGTHVVLNTFCGIHDGFVDEQVRIESDPQNPSQNPYLTIAEDHINNGLVIGLEGAHRGQIFYLDRYAWQIAGSMETSLIFLAQNINALGDLLFETLDQRLDRVLMSDDLKALKAIQAEISPTRENLSGRTLIGEAAFWGKDEAVKMLYELGHPLGRTLELGLGSLKGETMDWLRQQEMVKATGIEAAIEHPAMDVTTTLTDHHTPYPNAPFAVVLPEGFTPIPNAPSFGSQAHRIRIDAIALNGDLARQLPNFSEQEWVRRQYALVSFTPLTINHHPGRLYEAVLANGAFRLLLMLIEVGSKTLQLSGSYPSGDLAAEKMVRKVLLSWHPIELDPFKSFDFTFEAPLVGCQVAHMEPNRLSLTVDGFWPTEAADDFSITIFSAPVACSEAEYSNYVANTLQQEVSQTQPIVMEERPIGADGLEGRLLIAEVPGYQVWMAVLFGGGHAYHFFGMARNQIDYYFGIFQQLVKNFVRKAEIKQRDAHYEQAMQEILAKVKNIAVPQMALKVEASDEHLDKASHVWGNGIVGGEGQARSPAGPDKVLVFQLLSSDMPGLPVDRLQVFANPLRFRDVIRENEEDIQIEVGLNEHLETTAVFESPWTETAKMLVQPKIGRLTASPAFSIPDWPLVVEKHSEIVSLCAALYPDAPWLAYRTAGLKLNALPKRHAIGGLCPPGLEVPMGSDNQPMVYVGHLGSEPDYGLVWAQMGCLFLFHEATDLSRWRALLRPFNVG